MNKIIAIILLLFMVPLANAQELIERGNTLIIRNDMGGSMADYLARYSEMKVHASTIALDGECDSSCTLFLGFIPQQGVCITANAKLGFHRANRPEGTMVMLMNYPQVILMWLLAEGMTEDIKYLPDEIMSAMFARCPDILINPPKTEKID